MLEKREIIMDGQLAKIPINNFESYQNCSRTEVVNRFGSPLCRQGHIDRCKCKMLGRMVSELLCLFSKSTKFVKITQLDFFPFLLSQQKRNEEKRIIYYYSYISIRYFGFWIFQRKRFAQKIQGCFD